MKLCKTQRSIYSIDSVDLWEMETRNYREVLRNQCEGRWADLSQNRVERNCVPNWDAKSNDLRQRTIIGIIGLQRLQKTPRKNVKFKRLDSNMDPNMDSNTPGSWNIMEDHGLALLNILNSPVFREKHPAPPRFTGGFSSPRSMQLAKTSGGPSGQGANVRHVKAAPVCDTCRGYRGCEWKGATNILGMWFMLVQCDLIMWWRETLAPTSSSFHRFS